MSSTTMNDLLGNAQMFQNLFVVPLIDAMEQKLENMLQPVVQNQQDVNSRVTTVEGRLSAQGNAIANLQGNQTKALIGWGVLASAGLGIIGIGWAKIKSWLRLG